MSSRTKLLRPAVAILVSLVLFSCASTDDNADTGAISTEEMESLLGEMCRTVKARIGLAVDEIRSSTEDPETQRHAIEWQLTVSSTVRFARSLPDARAGILELWTRAHQMQGTVDSDFGKQYYGEQQPIAAKAAEDLVQQADQAGREMVGAERYEEVLAQVKGYASSHAFGREMKSGRVGASGILGAGGSAVSWVLSLPMKPFSLGKGVDKTAHSIQNVAGVADRAVDVVEDIPEVARLNVELLLLDLDRVKAISSIIADLDRVTKSIEGLEKTASTLPEDVREQVSVVLDQIDAKQADLRETLDHAKGLVAEADDVVNGARQTVEDVNAAVVQTKVTADSLQPVLVDLTAAGDAWTQTANAVTHLIETAEGPKDEKTPPAPAAKPAPAAPPAPEAGSGSVIVDVGDSSVKLAAAAEQLRGLTENVLTIIGSDDLTKRLEDVDGLAATTVDHITWRAIQLVVTLFVSFFALLFAYKFAAMRFLSR